MSHATLTFGEQEICITINKNKITLLYSSIIKAQQDLIPELILMHYQSGKNLAFWDITMLRIHH